MKNVAGAAAIVVAIGFGGLAQAGGLPEVSMKDDPVIYHSPTVWTGFYVGGFAGYGWSDAEYDKPDGGGFELFDFDLDGGLIGGQIGYDFQHGHKVFGIVGDFSWFDADDTYIHGPNDVFTHEAELNSVAMLRGRLGYAFDHTLVYATAGVAFVDVDLTACSGPPLPNGGNATDCTPKKALEQDYTSWVLGAGLEKQLGHGFSLFAEYLYVAEGDVDGDDDKDWQNEIEFDAINVVKVGVNFKIGNDRMESLK